MKSCVVSDDRILKGHLELSGAFGEFRENITIF